MKNDLYVKKIYREFSVLTAEFQTFKTYARRYKQLNKKIILTLHPYAVRKKGLSRLQASISFMEKVLTRKLYRFTY